MPPTRRGASRVWLSARPSSQPFNTSGEISQRCVLLILRFLILPREDGDNRRHRQLQPGPEAEGLGDFHAELLVEQTDRNVHRAGLFALVAAHAAPGKVIGASQVEGPLLV